MRMNLQAKRFAGNASVQCERGRRCYVFPVETGGIRVPAEAVDLLKAIQQPFEIELKVGVLQTTVVLPADLFRRAEKERDLPALLAQLAIETDTSVVFERFEEFRDLLHEIRDPARTNIPVVPLRFVQFDLFQQVLDRNV